MLISTFRKELHLVVLICVGWQNSCKICTNSPFSVTTMGSLVKIYAPEPLQDLVDVSLVFRHLYAMISAQDFDGCYCWFKQKFCIQDL